MSNGYVYPETPSIPEQLKLPEQIKQFRRMLALSMDRCPVTVAKRLIVPTDN